jgi:hypothetical protein
MSRRPTGTTLTICSTLATSERDSSFFFCHSFRIPQLQSWVPALFELPAPRRPRPAVGPERQLVAGSKAFEALLALALEPLVGHICSKVRLLVRLVGVAAQSRDVAREGREARADEEARLRQDNHFDDAEPVLGRVWRAPRSCWRRASRRARACTTARHSLRNAGSFSSVAM